jgi:alpha-galactosidase
MNRRLWQNDPDCLLLRPQKTELSETQREIYAYTCALLDNMIILSDDLSLYDDSSDRIFQHTLRLLGGRAKVLNIFNDEPSYLIEALGTKSGDLKLEVDLRNKTFTLKGS